MPPKSKKSKDEKVSYNFVIVYNLNIDYCFWIK
jgi:hypothetical protein